MYMYIFIKLPRLSLRLMKEFMMKKISLKPGTLLAPVPPVLVTCGSGDGANLFTVAWTGIINSNPPMTYVSVRPQRHSYALIRESGEFVINLVTQELAFAADFCGVKSGRDMDKFEAMSLTREEAQIVSCPLLSQSPLSLECKVTEVKHLGTHDMFLAEIVAVNAEEALLDSKGRLRLDKCGLVAYAHGEYYGLGKKLGKFGFSVQKKKST